MLFLALLGVNIFQNGEKVKDICDVVRLTSCHCVVSLQEYLV